MDLNLSEMTLRELHDLKKKIDVAVATYEERRLREARVELEIKAKELGFSLAELLVADAKVKRAPAKAKWRHRENHSLTWSGRGRKPAWFGSAEALPEAE